MDISVICRRLVKYLTLTWDKTIVFKDSLQFIQAFVPCLLRRGRDQFYVLRANFADITEKSVFDLLRKNVYPCDCMDSVERFAEKLPPVETLINRLTNTACSAAHYAHADDAFKTFRCTSMLDYHRLYLTTDVLLLAEIFES